MDNDLISREALKKEVENLVVGGAEGLKDYYENGSKSDENSWIGGVYDAWELIDNAPTVADRTEEVLSLQNTIAKLVRGIAENAPTVELTEEQAIDKLHETGWLIRHDKEMTERPQGDLISREALKEHKFLTPQVKVIGGRHGGKLKEQIIQAYQKGWNDCIDAIIDNAPTVECVALTEEAYSDLCLRASRERPKGEWIEENSETGAIGIKYTWVRCNQCGWNNSLVIPKNFCPKCGADMRGEE